ncbi:MAG: hypothetical protein H6734_17535 [Alphaproteobacteria bacterium]|nr:hypothetical protein [Alphaproteobacteria bacterium]
MLFLLLSLAFGGELTFSPDRPAIGESTGTPGAGHAIIEIGTSTLFDPTQVYAAAIGRIGLVDDFEIRVLSPSLVSVPGQLSVGGVGIGAKYATGLTEATRFSVVPEVFVWQGWSAAASLNLTAAAGAWGFWVNARPALVGADGATDLNLLAGGGVGTTIGGSLAPYVNAGAGVGYSPFVGGGTAILVGSRFQVDVGVDVYVSGGSALPLLQAGTSFAF